MARHLTMQERDRIAQLRHQGATQKEIAQALRRSPSTICRELRRNGSGKQYLAAQAHNRATRRRRERRLARQLENPENNAAGCRGLARYWSPEQIAGRLPLGTAISRVSPRARSTTGFPAARPVAGAPVCVGVGNAGTAPEDPTKLVRRSGTVRASLKPVLGWETSRVTPSSDQAPADWRHSWIASHVTRSWSRSDRNTRITYSRRSADA